MFQNEVQHRNFGMLTRKLSNFVQSNSHGIIAKCAELEIGNNSVSPCTTPNIIA